MSQWTKGKPKQRGPPPALFGESSQAASTVSLTGAGDGHVGSSAGGASLANPPSSGHDSASTGMPQLPTLTRTASRFRQDDGSGLNLKGDAPTGNAGPGASLASGTTNTAITGGVTGSVTGSGGAAAAFDMPLPMPQLRHAASSRATDRNDALWAEMQVTLEEVELSASEGTRIFGPDHDQKLAALRQAQIALAQAWARSEAEDAGANMDDADIVSGAHNTNANAANTGNGNAANTANAANNGNARPGTTTATSLSAGLARDDEASASGINKGAAGDDSAAGLSRDRDPVSYGGSRPLEQETQVDILLARKRREANDRYFQRVNQGVLDVVEKLEDVAASMRAVEQESVDIWGGSSSIGPGVTSPGDNESEARSRAV